MKAIRSFLYRKYESFVCLLALKIAESQRKLDAEANWSNHHKLHLTRERAIAQLENPEKVNDFEYLKAQVKSKYNI